MPLSLSKQTKKSCQYSFFRAIIPQDLQEHFCGTTGFQLSVNGVSDDEVQILCLKLKQLTKSIFAEIRVGMNSLDLDAVKNILRIEVRKQIKHTEHFALGTNVFDNVKKSKSIQNVSSQETKMLQDLSGENVKDYESLLDEKLEGILTSLEIDIDTTDTNYKNLRRKFIQLYLLRFDWIRTLINQTEHFDENEFRKEVDAKLGLGLFPELQPVIENYAPEPVAPYLAAPLSSLQSTSISKCIEIFIDEKKQGNSRWDDIREKTELEIRTGLNLLIEGFGDVPIGKITKDNAYALKSHIMNFPKNRTRSEKYKDKDLQQLSKMEIPHKDRIHPTTINKHLGNLSSFMMWGVNNGYCDTNSFAKMKIKQKKSARDERDRFTENEIKELFSKKNYLQYTNVKLDRYFAYWVPLIAIFSGMRANEISALYIDNIRKIKGNHRESRWCIDIVEEITRPDKRLKNTASRRIVPIHDTLIDLGFIDFINLLKRDKNRNRVFEELNYREGTYARRVSRFWNDKYLPVLNIKTPKNGFHSLRHTVIDTLKQKGIEPHFINELVGQSQGNIALDRYGKGYNPDIIYNKCLKKLVYETSNARGIDFHSLKIDWGKIIVLEEG